MREALPLLHLFGFGYVSFYSPSDAERKCIHEYTTPDLIPHADYQ
jgi:hypothetical protein